MAMGKRIKELREKRGLSQVELADIISVSKQTLYKYENDIVTNIPSDKIELIAKALAVSPSYLMGWTPDQKFVKSNSAESSQPAARIPVLGRVAAGIPINAVEETIDWEEIPAEMAATGEYFGLRIRGDSMSPRIMDGDTVIVRRQSDAETDDIVIALVNGNDGVCKKLKKTASGLMLISLNPAYEPMVFDHADIDSIPVSIIGRVVELRGKL